MFHSSQLAVHVKMIRKKTIVPTRLVIHTARVLSAPALTAGPSAASIAAASLPPDFVIVRRLTLCFTVPRWPDDICRRGLMQDPPGLLYAFDTDGFRIDVPVCEDC